MNESSFSQGIHRLLKKGGVYCWKINARFANGVPDSWLCGNKGNLWAEYKWLKTLPKKGHTAIPIAKMLSELQKQWITERTNCNIPVAVIIGSPEGIVILKGNEYRAALTTDAFRIRMKTKQETAKYLLQLLQKKARHDERKTLTEPGSI